MKRNTALGKSLSDVPSLCLSLFFCACVSQEIPQSRTETLSPVEATPEILPPKSYAQLITPQTSQRFQHLRKHQGQLLLARENLHLIFSGIPPISTRAAFTPLFAKAYRQAPKAWNTLPWLPIPELSLRTPEGERLPLVGQDVEAQEGHYRLVSLYRSPRAEARVYLSFVPQTAALEVEIEASSGKALHWDLRFSHSLGEEHPIPYQQETLAGLSIALLPDVSSIVSSVPLKADRDEIYRSISTISPRTRSGFYLLLDRSSLSQQTRLVSRALRCFQKQGSDVDANLDCLRPAWNQGSYWTLQLPLPPASGSTSSAASATLSAKASPRSDRRLMQSLYLHTKQGDFRSVLPIFEGEQVKIALPDSDSLTPASASEPQQLDENASASEVELLVPDTEGVLQHRTLDPASPVVVLPPLARGQLQLFVEPNEPSFVEVRDAVHQDGVTLQAWLNVRAGDLFSPHTLLQRSWPLLMQVPAGDYQVQVFNGTSVICQQRLAVRPERVSQVRCQAEGPQPKLSPRLSLSLDAAQHSPELLEAARIQVSSRVEKKAQVPSPRSPLEVPLIEATDPDLGLSMRAFPADEALRSEWNSVRTQREGVSPLQDFTRFVRAQRKDLQLVLECPAAGFQLEEYEWLALTFEPDILEVFGCLQPEMADKLLSIAQHLQQKSSKAIKLAAASPLRSLYPLYGEIPAIYLHQSQPASEEPWEALREGLYSVGLKSEIEVDVKAVNHSSRQLSVKIRSYNLKKRPGLLRVFDQEGQLSEFPLPPTSLTEWDVKVPLRLTPRSRWLRVELLSRESSNFLLASTNFLSLDVPR